MASTTSVLNLSLFSATELSALLTAVKAEVLARITGRVSTGGSAGQSFGVALYSTDELNRLANAIVAALGMDQEETRVRPCFSAQGVGAQSAPLLDGQTVL